MTSRRSVFVRLLFAFLLAFAQQQASRHALEHDFERIHDAGKSAGHDDAFCEKCLATAHLGHANSGAPAPLALAAHAPPRIGRVAFESATPAFAHPYRSRAPPSFS